VGNVKKKHSLKTQLSLNIAIVALLTVALTSVVSNILISRQFGDYVSKRHEQRIESILSDMKRQYDPERDVWDEDFLHAIGMRALYDGYIVKIYDVRQKRLWDAEFHDMRTCSQIMDDISRKMRERRLGNDEGFTVKNYALDWNGRTIAEASISYFSPYFYSDEDFRFLDSLNAILAGIGVFSLALAVTVGWILSRHMSGPIRKTVAIAKQMSAGDYSIAIEEKTNILELDELMKAINQLANSLGKQENLRKQLTADVAHELRTPLTNAATHIEAMIDGVWEPTPERLSGIYEETRRIGRLVSDMENLAKVESGDLKLDKTPLDLSELAEKTLRSFEAEIAKKNLAVSVEGNCQNIPADRNRMQQVLINLLSNAVKYTRTNGAIRVVMSETDDSAILTVEDDGIGITRDDLPFIFERFYRGDKSRSRLSGGSGIGLAMVKSIVTAHGGKVDVESRLDKGSRFRVILPKPS
jgi:signal transduction histidine kinase